MTSKLIVNSIRHTGASSDAITMDSSGNVTFPANATCSGTATGFGGGKFASYAVICDQKTSGTNGGTFTSGDWRTRDLNTEITDADGIVSISSNQFTLQAGTYLIKAFVPGYYVYDHKAKLYDVTASADVALGTSEYTSAQAQTRNVVTARVTISGATTYEIRHKCYNTKTNNGFGENNGYGVEIYLIVEIYKES